MTMHGVALKHLNTFAIDALAGHIAAVQTETELLTLWREAERRSGPVLLLGGGSNVLFLENFAGTVLLNRIKGIAVNEDDRAWHLHVGAGEDWHGLVSFTLAQGMAGLENLALIPGRVGSAPIQNIGAYGVELESVCEYVDLLDLNRGDKTRIGAAECQFGYRDSVFKHRYRDGYAIVAVGFVLAKTWRPVLTYGDLTRLDSHITTPRQVFDIVCAMRRSKLPDPAVTGNAGSFFKNPLVSAADAQRLLQQYPDAPHYPQPGGEVKLAAGWLIDKCDLKGYQLGAAAVHARQALVLINNGHARGQDIVALARLVRKRVAERFNVWLEPEVRFIAAAGEVDAVEVLS
ncbi:UDP-N-acetylmuramate dehydrogenase [Acerihabitans arboris]|uniref:UDP-N-acetylenolpyruvoylglucosamine reductase n=1 Tax=Acerihabitans arboris TaxID=2691583 RepID=A0A845SZ69_9GAMM|nr:UDP-N-acetylmuramate dehydrogenase [Acerihabitans arboris]NDL66085.1 UDP-N-acetylmuramate dehydrogenase [Acerihabitans arboris]